MTRHDLAAGAAAALFSLSVTVASPASADEGFYDRNGADRAVSGLDNGNGFTPPAPSSDAGFSTGDAALGALAGLILAGGAAGAVVLGRRRRDAHLPHPA